MKTRTRRN